MTLPGPIAITGATGRLGRALVTALARTGIQARPWTRPDYDLDDAGAGGRLVARDAPALVIHCAAWTDVDGCARDPAGAMRRNATAVAELSQAVVAADGALILISTNEVFDGRRSDGRGYREADPVNPINSYGESKLAGEQAARETFERAGLSDRLTIVRTAWLYGPPGNDFPTKVLAAADRLPPGKPLKVVADEVGSPTFSSDLAGAIVELIRVQPAGGKGGVYHLANGGVASRLEVATALLQLCRPDVLIEPTSSSAFVRASSPPAWSVLDTGKANAAGIVLRDWMAALRDYAGTLCYPPSRVADDLPKSVEAGR